MKSAKRGFNHLGAVARALPSQAGDIVEKLVTDVAAGAGATAPIDTGALAGSYRADMDSPIEGTAGSNMEYAPHVEYGTIHAAAQPHLVPSLDRVTDSMTKYARDLGSDIERKARDG